MRQAIVVFMWSLISATLIITAACIYMASQSPAHAAGRECGKASWYQAGLVTAEGKRYRPDQISVAHRSYRMGTMLRIVDQATGRAIVARVSDRGPYVGGRIIDVSRAAAVQLRMLDRGVIRACIWPVARSPP